MTTDHSFAIEKVACVEARHMMTNLVPADMSTEQMEFAYQRTTYDHSKGSESKVSATVKVTFGNNIECQCVIHFTYALKKDMYQVTGRVVSGPEDWVYTESANPNLANDDPRRIYDSREYGSRPF